MPENTERPSKTPNRLLKLKSRQRRKSRTRKRTKKKMYLSAFSRTQASSFAMSKTRSKKLCGQPQSLCLKTGVVLVTIIVVGLVIFGLDTAFMNLLGLIMNIA